MADSSITKNALAVAFKDLLKEKNFNKISINAICEKCYMNRKSFYYHFEDKYDLIIWIFNTEFLEKEYNSENESKELLFKLCAYFYENKEYYLKIFKIDGQNSFNEYFRGLLVSALRNRITEIMSEGEYGEFFADVFTDTVLNIIRRWIMKKQPENPEEFVDMIEKVVVLSAKHVSESIAAGK